MEGNKKIGKYVAIGLGVLAVAALIYWTPKVVKKIKESKDGKKDDKNKDGENVIQEPKLKGEYTLGAITGKANVHGQNTHGLQIIEKSKKPETVVNAGDRIKIEGDVPFEGNYFVKGKQVASTGYTYLFVVLQGHNDVKSNSSYQRKAKIKVYA